MANVVIEEKTESKKIIIKLQIYDFPQECEEDAQINAILIYTILSPRFKKIIEILETVLKKASPEEIQEIGLILDHNIFWLEKEFEELKIKNRISLLFHSIYKYIILLIKTWVFEIKKFFKK